ncbi:MAG: NAD(P)-dependent alcohol dehydrogenase [Kribbellaceae bacterium]
MKAVVQERYGSPEALQVREVGQPVAAGNEVLVRVHAAAVNAYDWHLMRGVPYLARLMSPADFGRGGPVAPIRGRDFAGRVDEVGGEVTRFQPGDEVYGDLGSVNGAFAEYARVPDDAVDPKPANLTFEQAAAIPLAANTALMGLRDVARLRAGQHVLVNGASGGVGTFAVQIAKAYGAEVTGVCSTRNLDLVRSVGADHVIDYSREDFTLGGRRYDVVFDLVGNHSLTAFRRALTPGGTLVLSGGGVPGEGRVVGPMSLMMRAPLLSRFVRDRLIVLAERPSRQNLATLRELAESGKLTPVIDRTYPLSEVADAIRYLENEHARAKVVITM